MFDKSGFVCCTFICVKLWERLRLFPLCWTEELLKLLEFMEVLLLFEKSFVGSFWFDVFGILFGWMEGGWAEKLILWFAEETGKFIFGFPKLTFPGFIKFVGPFNWFGGTKKNN